MLRLDPAGARRRHRASDSGCREGRAASLAIAVGVALAANACGGPRPEPRPVAPAPRPPTAPLAVAPDPAPAGRLSDAVVPRRAALELEIDPDSPNFRGRVAIDVDLTEPVSAIWLHASHLEFERASLVLGKRELLLRRLDPPPRGHDLLGLALGQRIGPGPARLTIDYGGRLGAKRGLFRQKADGTWYAFTDFEPTDARLAMPCFDDPRFKIPWRLTLRVPGTMRAFANAPELRAAPAENGWRRVEFAATPPLPSYLVAFAVGPFDVLEGAREPVPIRVIATRGRARLGAEALALAPGMLDDLERYLGTRTPFPKLDFLAVPTFNGAMENPGLITFAASILLLDPAARATGEGREQYRFMAGVVAHELAHLWFGDLVTMRWWDELWLNEGLATWMSDRLLAAAVPGEAGLVHDVIDKSPALDIDRQSGGNDRQPTVRQPVDQPSDIHDQFSPLSYRKGGAIAAMFEAYLGEERMREGLRRYVADNAGGSVTSAELFAALSAGAGTDLAPALASFIDQPGVPLVEATLACPSGGGRQRPTVSLRQSPYADLSRQSMRRTAGAAPAGQLWHIPVCVAWEGGEAPTCTLLSQERGLLELPSDRCPAWIHPNPGERGYYLYALPPAQLRALAATVPRLTAREQAGLADDLDALLAGGVAPLAAALDATWLLARRPDPTTALRASQTLALVARSLVGPRQRRAFAAHLRAAFDPLVRQLGLAPRDGESRLDAQLRAQLVPLVGRQGDERSLQLEAYRRLTLLLDGARRGNRGKSPDEEELALLHQLAPLAGGPVLFNRLLAAGPEHTAAALAGFRQPALIERALAMVRHDRLRPPQALDVLAALLRDGSTQDLALPVALAEYPVLAPRLADTERSRSATVFASVCRSGARPRVEEALRRALAPDGGELLPLARGVLARISACAAFREFYLAAAQKYFR